MFTFDLYLRIIFTVEENWHGGRMYWSHFGWRKNIALLRKAGFKIKAKNIVGERNNRHMFVFATK